MPPWFKAFARRVPVLGWALGALVAALLAALYYARRARLLAGQLRAEREIAKIKTAHQRYIRAQLEGHGRTSNKVAQQWHKLTANAQADRDALRRRASSSKGLADAWNDVFSP